MYRTLKWWHPSTHLATQGEEGKRGKAVSTPREKCQKSFQ